jgi:hypothetical protein
MKALRSTYWVFCTLALALVVGCAQMGVASPNTFNEKLAVAVAANTEVRSTAAVLLQAGKISAEDAKNVLAQTDVARQGLDVARSMAGTDLSTATSRLEATTAALKALQTYLTLKQGGKP